MRLNSRKPEVSLPLHLNPQNWYSSRPETSTAKPQWQPSTWVQLQEPPSTYSHDEALLLCPHSETEWVVWIPEYGETILHQNQFFQDCGV